ncbi:MAG: sigma-70 family RNA polymerase sigma factor [Thermoguttaceae bacterium]|nr:sigma-70 family RNA polymerase sigma factor [Thermoguttaceae bacterium]
MNHNTNPTDAPHYEEIRRYCVRLTNSETEADDLTQEVFIRLYESGQNLEGTHLRNWLFRVARNLVIDNLRVKHPERIAPEIEGMQLADIPDSKSANPAKAVEQQDLIRYILSVLEQCDKRTREIFRLKFYEDKTSSEIGSQVGISSSTVRKILLGKIQEFREAYRKMEAVG